MIRWQMPDVCSTGMHSLRVHLILRLAKAIRDDRLPEDDHSEACSMCGKFCAVRSMNKALAGEYIDIL